MSIELNRFPHFPPVLAIFFFWQRSAEICIKVDMLLNYLSFLILTWTVSQTLKFLFKSHITKSSLRDARETFLYYSGPPSSHSAILAMTLLYIRAEVSQNSPIFIIFLVFSILWIYEIFMQRKRFSSLVAMLGISKADKSLIINQEFHGHEVFDILAGITLGFLVYFTAGWFWG